MFIRNVERKKPDIKGQHILWLHLYEVQIQAKLISCGRGKNDGYLWGSIDWGSMLDYWNCLYLDLCGVYMDIHYINENFTELYIIIICAFYSKLYFNKIVLKSISQVLSIWIFPSTNLENSRLSLKKLGISTK